MLLIFPASMRDQDQEQEQEVAVVRALVVRL